MFEPPPRIEMKLLNLCGILDWDTVHRGLVIRQVDYHQLHRGMSTQSRMSVNACLTAQKN